MVAMVQKTIEYQDWQLSLRILFFLADQISCGSHVGSVYRMLSLAASHSSIIFVVLGRRWKRKPWQTLPWPATGRDERDKPNSANVRQCFNGVPAESSSSSHRPLKKTRALKIQVMMWQTKCCIACKNWLVICQGFRAECLRMYSYVTSILADVKHNCQPVPIVLCSTGSVGRPRFEISNCQLEYFFGYKLTCKDIAKVLGVGASTT